jgi:hypothetical protein
VVRLRPLFVCLLTALALVPVAHAGPGLILGVDDDQARWMNPAGAVTPIYRELGVRAVRVTLQWAPGQTQLTSSQRVQLDRAGVATWGLRLVVAVDGDADAPPADAGSREQYCSFVASLVRRYPTINDVVIWTEPNSATFWRPQAGAPAAYEALLARCWDVLHGTRSNVNVIAASAPHQNPAAWYAGIGAALKASGRTQPILDTYGHNAYPETSGESPLVKHSGNSIDQGDYDRLVATLRGAFAGSGQPAPGDRGTMIWYMEDGFQTKLTQARQLYTGAETDRYAITEQKQAKQVDAAIRLAYCQPFVGAWFNFQLKDETQLSGWQSGLVRADWSTKPAFYAFRDALIDVVKRRVVCN